MMQLLHFLKALVRKTRFKSYLFRLACFSVLIGSSFENHELNIQLRFVSLAVWILCQHSLSFHFCSFVFF